MNATPFADLEARTANVVNVRLANAVAVATPAGGGIPASINVIFDADYVDVLGVQSQGPVLLATDAVIAPYSRHGAVFQVRGNTYKSVEVQPDGTGMTLVLLRKVSE